MKKLLPSPLPGRRGAPLLAIALLGCSAGVGNGGTGGGGGSGGLGAAVAASTGSGFEAGAGGGGTCAAHCTADLHQYVDCNGKVLVTCGSDQGCLPDGTCGPPCDAAAKNQSTIGCDFFSATTPVSFGARGGCFAALVANTWTSPVQIALDYDGQTIDASQYTYLPTGQGSSLTFQPLTGGKLQPGQLGVVMLSHFASGEPLNVACPVPAALEVQTQVDTTGRGHAFHVTTTAPVVAYDVYPWGGATSYATSSTLLLPTSSWGTNFVTSDAWSAEHGQPFTQIVGSVDGTTVTMVPSHAVPAAGGVSAMAANTPSTFTINRGEIVQLLQDERLAGSRISSDQPISVWGGSSCMNIPTGMDACDTGHQELLPVVRVGAEYVGARYPSRGGDDSAPYTLVGMVNGTQLTFDPPQSTAPLTLSAGQVVTFFTSQAFTVKSQGDDHPFYLAAHMTGGGTNSEGLGDPDYVNVISPKQYLKSYLFVTDPTYANTSLVFTRKRDTQGQFHDVKLDCVGVVNGWTAVDAADSAEVARVKMVDHGHGLGSCNNGVHTADSDGVFGLTVWGYDYYASYAYPAGMSVEPINNVVVPPVPN